MVSRLAYSPTLTLLNSLVAVYKIYVLKDPFNDEVFYVGQTQQELNTRLAGHLGESRGVNPQKRAKFDEIIQKGGKPLIEAVETINGTCYIDKLHVNNREFHWIKYYRSRQARLTNAMLMTDQSGSKDYQHYLRSIKEGQGYYKYYFCGTTPGGHEVYDEKRMRADGFKLPDSPPEPVKIVEKVVEKVVYIDRPSVQTVFIPEMPEQPQWTEEFRVQIPFPDPTEDFIEDEDGSDWEIDSDLEPEIDCEQEDEEDDLENDESESENYDAKTIQVNRDIPFYLSTDL